MVFLRFFCLLCAVSVVPTYSWGRDAHEIIATMASHYLTDTAAKKVSALLHGANMSSVANWADQVHYQPEYSWSEPVHFTNVQDTSKACLSSDGYGKCTFVYERDCVDRDGNKDFCNAGALANFSAQVLKSKGKVSNATTDALKFVIHLVADIHQPLHVGMAPDRGGVKMNVEFMVPGQGTRWNLHNIWDFGEIIRAEGTEGHQMDLIASMLARMQSGAWANETTAAGWGRVMDPKVWVQEGLDVATSAAYRFPNGTALPMYHPSGGDYDRVTLDDSYMAYMSAGGVIELQLCKAAYRTALHLNKLLA